MHRMLGTRTSYESFAPAALRQVSRHASSFCETSSPSLSPVALNQPLSPTTNPQNHQDWKWLRPQSLVPIISRIQRRRKYSVMASKTGDKPTIDIITLENLGEKLSPLDLSAKNHVFAVVDMGRLVPVCNHASMPITWVTCFAFSAKNATFILWARGLLVAVERTHPYVVVTPSPVAMSNPSFHFQKTPPP